ncbi:MAG: hypothetical protein KAR11_08200 [Phycisphaerae bacterium]|nr:hypothetical protein [Phycisphaerae bacterium]
MRPTPSSKHILAVIVFLAVAAISTYVGWLDTSLSDEQVNLATAAAKRHNPNAMPLDAVYGKIHSGGDMRQVHSPAFLALMEMSLIPTLYNNLELPFRVGVFPFVLLYLCGMYALLWRQCRSSSIAAFVSVMSIAVIPTFGSWFSGIGTLESITPEGLVLVFSPLLVLCYLRTSRNNKTALPFCLVGLCANIHLVSAVNLAFVLLIVHLGRNRFKLRSVWEMLVGAFFFLVGAMPYIVYFIVLRFHIASKAGDVTVSAAAILQAIQISDLDILYPRLLDNLDNWGIYIIILGSLSLTMLWRFDRFRAQDMDVWLWMAGCGVFVAIILQGILQVSGLILNPIVGLIDLTQASCWVMLPLYVMFAQALTHLFRIVRKNRAYLRLGCAVFMIAWFLPSKNLLAVRHEVYALATSHMEESEKSLRIQELSDRADQKDELTAIADWANNKTNTDDNAMFMTYSNVFRMKARRNIFVCREDFPYFYQLSPWLLDEWADDIELQSRMLASPIRQGQIITEVAKISKRPAYKNVSGWYVILPIKASGEELQLLEEIKSDKWGKHLRLFRIPK